MMMRGKWCVSKCTLIRVSSLKTKWLFAALTVARISASKIDSFRQGSTYRIFQQSWFSMLSHNSTLVYFVAAPSMQFIWGKTINIRVQSVFILKNILFVMYQNKNFAALILGLNSCTHSFRNLSRNSFNS